MTRGILGIDIAKDTYDVALVVDEQSHSRKFKNREEEFGKLAKWLSQKGVSEVHACMEATGRYGDALAHWLHGQGHTVSIVNPMVIRAYGMSQMARNKTDKVDAALIARYCQKEEPRAWAPAPPEVAELQALLQELEALQTARIQESNRLQSGIVSKYVRETIEAHVRFLDEQIERMKARIDEHMDGDAKLNHQRQLLSSIPGIGALTAARLAAAQLDRFADGRAAAAYAGLSPAVGESGSSVRRKTKLSKRGNAGLRKALYWPAIVGLTCNPVVKAMGERLKEKHKHAMVVIGAAMRKMLCLAYGVLKSDQPFDAEYMAKRAQAA